MLSQKNKIAFLIIGACAIIAGLTIYLTSLNTFFASDDFIVLDNLIKGNLVYGTAFRPLSNLSLFLDYKIAGLSPFCYKIISLLIHIINSLLVFAFVKSVLNLIKAGNVKLAAMTSSVLFFLFPFHLEAITWITCRGTLLATSCFLLAVIFYLKDTLVSKAVSILLFSTGIFFYESIYVFPFIVLLIEWYKGFSLKKIAGYFSGLALVFLLYTLVKYFYTSAFVSTWFAETLQHLSIQQTAKNIFISFSRCFLPPHESTLRFVLLSVILISIIIGGIIRSQKNNSQNPILFFAAFIFISLIPAFIIGTDSHDIEGARLLYLPAVATCMAISFLIIKIAEKNNLSGIISFAGVAIYFLFYLFQYCSEWKTSGNVSGSAIKKINEAHFTGKLYVIGLPQQYKGAFIFRNGFNEAVNLFCREAQASQIKILSKKEINNIADYETPGTNNKGNYQIGQFEINLGDSTIQGKMKPGYYKLKLPEDKILYFSKHEAKFLFK
ncbi:MAG: hypothetical protein ACHQNT_01790 [Bacteroidia bacterium]